MVDLLFDTSFLMLLASRPVARLEDIEASLGKVEPVVLKDVVEELRVIGERASVKRARVAKLALEYASKLREVSSGLSGDVDDKVLRYAVEHGVAVATMDSVLKHRLRAAGVVVVTCRGNRVVVEGL